MRSILILILFIISASNIHALVDDGGAGNMNQRFNLPIHTSSIFTFSTGYEHDIISSDGSGSYIVLKYQKKYSSITKNTALFGGMNHIFNSGLKRFVVSSQKSNGQIHLRTISFDNANRQNHQEPRRTKVGSGKKRRSIQEKNYNSEVRDVAPSQIKPGDIHNQYFEIKIDTKDKK